MRRLCEVMIHLKNSGVVRVPLEHERLADLRNKNLEELLAALITASGFGNAILYVDASEVAAVTAHMITPHSDAPSAQECYSRDFLPPEPDDPRDHFPF